MSSKPSSKAFTLIEMLIALALISTIVTMVYGSYAATSRSLEVYGTRMACGERSHLALRFMARQLRGAYLPPTETPSEPTSAKRNDRPAGRVAIFQAEPLNPSGEVLDFITTGGFAGIEGLVRVRYRYDRSDGTLYTCCEPLVVGTRGSHEPTNWQPILRGITDIELTFLDGRQWKSGWDSRHTRRLPQAARIALTIADESGRSHSYRATVPIVCHTTPPQRPAAKPEVRP